MAYRIGALLAAGVPHALFEGLPLLYLATPDGVLHWLLDCEPVSPDGSFVDVRDAADELLCPQCAAH